MKKIFFSKPFIGKEEATAVVNCIKSGHIAQGSVTRQLEQAFSQYFNTCPVIAVSSGTAALHCALHALGISKNNEVITTPYSFIATANAILMMGAKPIFADIDSKTFCIDPNDIEKKITDKTKAIIAVDLFGNTCDYDSLHSIAKKHSLFLIEDAAQAIGSMYNQKNAGTFGAIATFSFYATKNITCGEGGLVVASKQEYADSVRLFKQHGRSKKTNYQFENLGFNYRMTDISAAVLLEQIKKLPFITKKRNENAAFYNEKLGKIKGITIPFVPENVQHSFHQYVIKIEDSFGLTRDQVLDKLTEMGIRTIAPYSIPIHLRPHFKKFGYREGDFPVTEEICNKVLSLPVHPHLTNEELRYIVDSLINLE